MSSLIQKIRNSIKKGGKKEQGRVSDHHVIDQPKQGELVVSSGEPPTFRNTRDRPNMRSFSDSSARARSQTQTIRRSSLMHTVLTRGLSMSSIKKQPVLKLRSNIPISRHYFTARVTAVLPKNGNQYNCEFYNLYKDNKIINNEEALHLLESNYHFRTFLTSLFKNFKRTEHLTTTTENATPHENKIKFQTLEISIDNYDKPFGFHLQIDVQNEKIIKEDSKEKSIVNLSNNGIIFKHHKQQMADEQVQENLDEKIKLQTSITKFTDPQNENCTIICPKPNNLDKVDNFYKNLKLFLIEGDEKQIDSFWKMCGQEMKLALNKNADGLDGDSDKNLKNTFAFASYGLKDFTLKSVDKEVSNFTYMRIYAVASN